MIIYSISCPVSNNIVYVGCTTNYTQRKYIHEHGYGNCEVNKWERGILKMGLIPIVEILDEDFFERYWVEQIRSWGFDLLNSKNCYTSYIN